MKMIRNAVLAAAAFFFGASAFADVEFEAYNKLSSDTVIITHDDAADDDDTAFEGFKNRVHAELLTEKIDAMIEADILIGKYECNDKDGDDKDDWGLVWDDIVHDWYVEIRPVDSITLGFHDQIFADGSYLPIYDDNLSAGNIGSDGFTFVYRPSWKDGFLRLASTIPFGTEEEANWIYADESDTTNGESFVEDDTFDIGFGAIADFEKVQLGVSVQDVADDDERTFGFYANFPGLFGANENMNLGLGFAFSESYVGFEDFTEYAGLVGDTVFNAAFTYEGDKWGINAEVVTNFGEDDFTGSYLAYDVYAAVNPSFNLTEKLTLGGTFKVACDTSDDGAENAYAYAVTLDIDATEHNSFEVEADLDVCDKDYTVKFPVYWKYTF